MLSFTPMSPLRARVHNGQLVLDKPLNLPEGHELELRVVNDDGMSDSQRTVLHEALSRGISDMRAGRVSDFDDFLDELGADDRADDAAGR